MGDDQREEKFRKTLTGWCVSSLGYRVKFVPRFLVRYRDRWDSLEIKAEMLAFKPYGCVIEIESIPENLHFSRKEIVDRVRRAFASDGAIVEIFPDHERSPSLLLVAGASKSVSFSYTENLLTSPRPSAQLDGDSEAQLLSKQHDLLWRGVCQWAEDIGVDRVKLDYAIPDARKTRELGFIRRGLWGDRWFDYQSVDNPEAVRRVLEALPQLGRLWLSASVGEAVVIVVSGNWGEISVQPPPGDSRRHLARFQALLAEVKAAGNLE